MPKLITNPDDLKFTERDEMLSMLGNPPSGLLYYGITAAAAFFGILLLLSYLIKYPDVVTCKVVLTTENPPIRVLAQTSGRVSELLVQENESVAAGKILAVMENTADWHDVLRLENILNGTRSLEALPEKNFRLGNLQGMYSTFTQNLKDYRYFSGKNDVAVKTAFMQQQISSLHDLNNNLSEQKAIQQREFELTQTDFQRQTALHKDGVISDLDFEKAKTILLVQQRQLTATTASFINNDIQIRQNESQINDLSQNKSDSKNTKELTLAEDARRLLSAVQDWKKQNLITAPISGKVTLSKIWSNQQAIAAGDEFLTVVPDNVSQKIICKAVMPIAGSGKVKPGLRATIKLDNFPFQQFGILTGTVQNISPVPQKDNYSVEISVNNTLETTYHKTIPFQQEMQGTANIITEDKRVAARIFEKVNDLAKNFR